jgi:hypothetical protein
VIEFLFKYVARPFWMVFSILVMFVIGLFFFAVPVYFAVILAIATGHTFYDRGFFAWVAGGAFVGFVLVVTFLHKGQAVNLTTLRGQRETPHKVEK